MARSPRRTAGLVSALAVALVAASALTAAAQDPGSAELRVLHASPGAPAVDVYADGSKVLTNVAYGVISSYLEVPAGEHRIQVFATGSDVGTETPLIDATISLGADSMTTVAATDRVDAIELQVVPDRPAPVSDAAQVRWVALAADLPPVDVTTDGGDDLVSALEYPAVGDYLTVAPGPLAVTLQPSGAVDGWVVYDPGSALLDAGTSYSAFIIGSLADHSIGVVTALDATAPPLPAHVRILHASTGAGRVDLWIDGEPVEADVPFGAISGYLALDAGAHRIELYAAGSDPLADGVSPLLDTTLSLDPDQATTLVAVDDGSGVEPLLIADDPVTTAGKASVRVVNLVPDATAAGAARAGKARFADGIGYGQASGYQLLPGGTQRIVVDVAGTSGGAMVEVDRFTAPKARAFTLFLIGSIADESIDTVVADDDLGEG